MSIAIPAPPLVAQTATSSNEAKAKEDVAKVARDFEAILVRQLLSSSKVAAKGGYGDMAVEALATAVSTAGGLGMGRAIEDALSRHHRPDVPTSAPAPAVPGTAPEKK